jgi:hypothetical protein
MPGTGERSDAVLRRLCPGMTKEKVRNADSMPATSAGMTKGQSEDEKEKRHAENANDHEREGARTSGDTWLKRGRHLRWSLAASTSLFAIWLRSPVPTRATLDNHCDKSVSHPKGLHPMVKKPTKRRAIKPLLTIGYEQATVGKVIDELNRAKVDIVIDTRAVAASRKPGFSKKQLAAGLDERGVGYLHLQGLGTPKEGRIAARSGKLDKLFSIYQKHLKTAKAREELDELTALARTGKRLCLLCFERDPKECHRQWIAEIVHERTGAKVEHLAAELL